MRFQFSIRWIFAVTALVGLALAALSAKPSWISGLLIQLIFLAMPGLVAVVLVAGRGYVRAFAIGAAAPTLIGFAIAGRVLELAEYLVGQRVDLIRFFAIFVWSATLIGGTAAVVIRWLAGTAD